MHSRIAGTRLSYKQVANSLGRLVLTEILAFGIGIVAISKAHDSYWNKTIFRVQTVDFNILSHALPTTLSYAIVQKQPEALQLILDSNYGLFGLVVTDSSGKSIVTYSGKGSNKQFPWTEALTVEKLQNYPYDLLLNPPPLYPQGIYSDSRAEQRISSGFRPQGLPIGRVYYLRNKNTSFQQAFLQWLREPISDSGQSKLYNPIMLACFFGGIALWSSGEYFRNERQLWQKERKQLKQVKQEVQRLKQQKETHIQQTSRFLSQTERYQQKQQKQILQLEQLIADYKNQLIEQEKDQEETTQTLQNIERLQQQLEEAQQRESEAQQRIDALTQKIIDLENQRDEVQQKLHNSLQQSVPISQLEEAVEAVRTDLERQIQDLEGQIQAAKETEDYAVEEAHQLEKELEDNRNDLNEVKKKNYHLREKLQQYQQQPLDKEQNIIEQSSSIPWSSLKGLSAKQTIRALEHLGFVRDRQNGSHIMMKKTITCVVPNKNEIPPGTIKSTLQQAKVSLEEFLNHL